MDQEQRPIGYWARRLDEALEHYLDLVLAHEHLTRRQWQVLAVLAQGPLPPAAVHEALRPFWSAAGEGTHESELAALVRRGYLTFAGGLLALTQEGTAKHTTAEDIIRHSRQDLTMGIGIDEYASAVSVLERMAANAERLAAQS
jgi:hypothetical protein